MSLQNNEKQNDRIRVIIAGSRNFNNMEIVEAVMLDRFGSHYSDIELVGGGAKGADALGKQFAKKRRIPYKEFPADWGTYHNTAGPIRNRQMAQYASAGKNTGILVAFWDGRSRGTKHMIDTARDFGMEVQVVYISCCDSQ